MVALGNLLESLLEVAANQDLNESLWNHGRLVLHIFRHSDMASMLLVKIPLQWAASFEKDGGHACFGL